MNQFVLSIDQGTTSSRALVFNQALQLVGNGQQEFAQHYPEPGWVEHAPEDIWQTSLLSCHEAIKSAGIHLRQIAAIGITNQRETTLVWDKETGKPVYNAIVWQDRRTQSQCKALIAAGHAERINTSTGLLLDPYFSATKLAWLLDTIDNVRQQAEAGQLLFGTVDTYLIWKLTGGATHATDATNASRTMLFNIHSNQWDVDLCHLFGIPMQMLPEVKDCADDFGVTDAQVFGASIPIRGVAGDQQAAAIGQACFSEGMLKATYGTGCFALLNTGDKPVTSTHQLLTTIAYRLDGRTTYALEGSIFIAGAVVQWLRDVLRIIDDAAQTEVLAQQADPAQPVYFVPAFTGLGAPYWDAESRGAIYGLHRNTGRPELVRAALSSVAYQTRDLVESMQADWQSGDASGAEPIVLRVDGGLSANNWAMQFLSDMLGASVDRPGLLETTALGAAWLAGMQVGLFPGGQTFADQWSRERRFEPSMDSGSRDTLYAGWSEAVQRTLTR